MSEHEPRINRPALASYVLAGLAMFSLGFYQEAPFQYNVLSADAVVVGTVLRVDVDTFDFRVHEWMRARGCGQPKELQVAHLDRRTCTTAERVDFRVGSRYLLLLQKPSDSDSGSVRVWKPSESFDLATPSICLEHATGIYLVDDHPSCPASVTVDQLVDAVRSFDACFDIRRDGPRGWGVSAQQRCTDRALKAWEARSAFHNALSRMLLPSVERQVPESTQSRLD